MTEPDIGKIHQDAAEANRQLTGLVDAPESAWQTLVDARLDEMEAQYADAVGEAALGFVGAAIAVGAVVATVAGAPVAAGAAGALSLASASISFWKEFQSLVSAAETAADRRLGGDRLLPSILGKEVEQVVAEAINERHAVVKKLHELTIPDLPRTAQQTEFIQDRTKDGVLDAPSAGTIAFFQLSLEARMWVLAYGRRGLVSRLKGDLLPDASFAQFDAWVGSLSQTDSLRFHPDGSLLDHLVRFEELIAGAPGGTVPSFRKLAKIESGLGKNRRDIDEERQASKVGKLRVVPANYLAELDKETYELMKRRVASRDAVARALQKFFEELELDLSKYLKAIAR